MKTLFILLTFFLMSFSHAKASCLQTKGLPMYSKLKTMPLRDKTMHCTLSCFLAIKCGRMESFGAGVAKEIWDMFTPGDMEWADLKADWKGIDMARFSEARNFNQCLEKCSVVYEPKTK
jgi:hypothetical protein